MKSVTQSAVQVVKIITSFYAGVPTKKPLGSRWRVPGGFSVARLSLAVLPIAEPWRDCPPARAAAGGMMPQPDTGRGRDGVIAIGHTPTPYPYPTSSL